MKPYYDEGGITIYHGDAVCVLALIDTLSIDAVIADPPYAETNLQWDRWPDSWPQAVAQQVPRSAPLWCFGSLRMFLDRSDEFAQWSIAQEVVWEKHNGSNFHADRFRRVHELAVQWYRGEWANIYRAVVTTPDATARTVRKKARPPQWHGATGDNVYRSEDGGPRLQRSVIYCRSEHGRALHPTQKPLGILEPLVRYSCPPGGTVLDLFAGAGSASLAAKQHGCRSIAVEADERYCEIAAKRLAQGVLDFGVGDRYDTEEEQ